MMMVLFSVYFVFFWFVKYVNQIENELLVLSESRQTEREIEKDKM